MREFVVKIDMEEMPKSCDDCDIAIKYQRFGTEIQCPFLGWYADRDNCPIICQLPEEHGDLVDWNDVEKQLDAIFADYVDDVPGFDDGRPCFLRRKVYPDAIMMRPIKVKIIIPEEGGQKHE